MIGKERLNTGGDTGITIDLLNDDHKNWSKKIEEGMTNYGAMGGSCFEPIVQGHAPDSESADPKPETHQSDPAALETTAQSGLCAPSCCARPVPSEDEIAFWERLGDEADAYFNSDPDEIELHNLSSEEDVLYWNNVIRNLYESRNGPQSLYLQVRQGNIE